MKTDPRIDQNRLTRINQRHKNAVIPIVRLVKRWSRRKWGISIPSYLLESLIINYYSDLCEKISYHIDWEFRDVLDYLANQVIFDVCDPKGIIKTINYLNYHERLELANKLRYSYKIASDAINAEVVEKDHIKAIRIWKSLLGDDFAN
ncbi:hypothetical protein [Deinococcus arenicola]|uniref:Uncharacterized protein n=1 Tax=Deinococcus arenicola TaxID=2994950 RepID=A0ABU4DS48_9DEIO|nr:hypothetical protein [Deinococcus sp. ZS9-10]MDV6375249.1 hypothetical protein [Deinococcus sp. ZS9-10]